MRVSFNGRVLLGGSTKRLSLHREIKQIREYAAKNDCDVLVCNRDYTPDDVGIYHTVFVKESPINGENYVFLKDFDFTKEKFDDTEIKRLYVPKSLIDFMS